MSLSKNECGWCTDVNEPPVDEHLYPFPDDIEGEVTAFFVGRKSYPVGNTWHGILVYFITDDGRPVKTIAPRMYWYNHHGYGACLGKWEEGAIYSAWNSPFPVDFAYNVELGLKFKVVIRKGQFHYCEPYKTLGAKSFFFYGSDSLEKLQTLVKKNKRKNFLGYISKE